MNDPIQIKTSKFKTSKCKNFKTKRNIFLESHMHDGWFTAHLHQQKQRCELMQSKPSKFEHASYY